MRRPITLVLVVASIACAQTIVVPPDAGETPDADATDRDASTSDAGATDGGATSDGGAFADGGSDAGTTAGHQWGVATLPANTGSVNAIWAGTDDEVYLGTSRSALLRSNGAAWDEVWREPSNFAIVDVDGDANLFVASEGTVFEFQRQPFSLLERTTLPRVRSLRAIAADRAGGVFVTATLQNGRGLYHLQPTEVVTIAEPTNVSVLESLYYDDDGSLYVGGNGSMFRYASSALIEETVEWPNTWSMTDIVTFTFQSITKVDGVLYAVGEREMIFTRGGTGTWTVLARGDDATFNAIGGLDPIYVVGEPVDGQPIRRLDDSAVTAVEFMQNVELRSIWRLQSGHLLLGGFVRNGIDGVLIRGVR